MSQFSDQEQESTFQEVFEKVNKIDFSVENPRWIFNEKDLRKVFQAGVDFGVNFVGENERWWCIMRT